MAEVILNVAFVVYVGSSWLKQELWLRVGLMISSLGSFLFGVLIDSPTTIVWNGTSSAWPSDSDSTSGTIATAATLLTTV